MKAAKKLLSLLLVVCMVVCMLPTAASAADSDGYMKIAMLDSGRKYFTVDWVKAFIYEAKADGYTHVMLAVGNDGMRFLLDDMSVSVDSTTYSSAAVKSAIQSGNTSYTTASTGEWTESEMNEIFNAANAAGIEIIPLLNSPGHMDAILQAASSLTGTTCSYNSSSTTIDVTNSTAVAFSQAFIQKYITYFASKGCKYFNFGADEYANDRYTTGSMGFGNLQSSGKYGYFIKYVNEIATMIKNAGMTPIAFNDGIEFANYTSATVGSTTYTFDKDIVICYWSSGWSGYSPRTAANLVSDGFRIINTTGDFYYVLGKSDNFDSGYSYASNWSNYKVCGTTLSSSAVIGGMFCMWSDYPGAETETQEAAKIRLPLRAMALAMDGSYTSSMDESVVPGGFNADGTVNTDPPAQIHDYHETSAQEPTCTEAGSITYTCADCGDSYTETVPALGHDYAAADNDGDRTYTCTRCNDSYSELLPREYLSLKVGQTSEKYTLDGEKTISHQGDAAVASADLNYVPGTGTEVSYSATATASVAGYTSGGYYCPISKIIDGDTSTFYWSSSSQTVGMYARVDLGADVWFDAIQVSSPAHGDYCSRANVQVSSDGNNWTTIGTYTGSSSSAVTSTYTVPDTVESFRYIQVVITTARSYWWQLSEIAWGSYDGTTFTRAETSGTVQTGTLTTTELTFTGVGAGTTYYVVDGTRYVIEVEEDHIHNYQQISETEPTCTADGEITYQCVDCLDTYTETVPATGHDYSTVVTAPTCTAEGYTTYTCSNCGDSYTADTVAALGHDYIETVVPATCTTDGTATYTCSRCNDSYTVTIPATGHNYTVSVSEATCTQDGTTTYVCANCGDSYTEITSALGHDYAAVVTAPTCTADGYTTYTCERCGYSYTDNTVSALGHSYTAVVTAPTCTVDGYTTYTCERCGDSYTDNIVPAVGHSYTAVVTAATCTVDGYTTYTCERCGDSYTDNIVPALGHSYSSAVTAATCTTDGYTTYTCDLCGDSYTGDTVPALGHDYTCTEDGDNLIYTCTRCDDSYTETLMPKVAIKLNVGETYTFNTTDATVTEDIDSDVASIEVNVNSGGYNLVSSLSDGNYLLVCSGSVLTTNASTYYSSWDGAGTVNGLSCTAYSSAGNYDDYLWTITAVTGGYTIQSADGRYLNITAGSKSSSITLSSDPQVITITDLGDTFSIKYSNTYLDRYSSAFVAAYPGSANTNEQWYLYKAEVESYDVTITGISGGQTSPVIGGTHYEIDVHAHDYTAEVTSPATCTEDGVMTYSCDGCGESYTEAIPATGHNYSCTETDDAYIYTCDNCGDSYSEPVVTTTYNSVSSISSGNRYVITVYSSGTYYAVTHNGTSLGVEAVTMSDGKITSDVTDNMLWNYSSNKFSFTSGSTTYYLYKSGYSTIKISTSGTNSTYSSNRLGFNNYYLRYSNGSLSLSRFSYTTCYMFEETN